MGELRGAQSESEQSTGAALIYHGRALFESLHMGAYACDADGRVRWFNTRAVSLWGREPAVGEDGERFCGTFKVYDLNGGAPLRREETPMAHALRTGEAVFGRRALIEKPSGETYLAVVHISPVRDAKGRLVGAVNLFSEEAEASDDQRALRDREQLLKDILQALPAAVYTTDAEGRATFFNEAAAALAGRRPELGVDKWCVSWRLHYPDGRPMDHEHCPMAIAIKENRPVRGEEIIAERPDGARVPVLPFSTPLHDSKGGVVGAVNMLVDIGHRKEAETSRKAMHAELNHRVKNNLQMLHSLLRLSLREARGDEARAALADASARVSALAAAHAALYRTELSGRFDAGELIRRVCEAARNELDDTAVLSCETEDIRLANDIASPLALIVNELVTNAGKHGRSPSGKAHIVVSLAADDETGFRLVVEDGGQGFDYDGAARNGLGLELVRGLAGQLRGEFRVGRGRSGAGARCVVRAPATKAATGSRSA